MFVKGDDDVILNVGNGSKGGIADEGDVVNRDDDTTDKELDDDIPVDDDK